MMWIFNQIQVWLALSLGMEADKLLDGVGTEAQMPKCHSARNVNITDQFTDSVKPTRDLGKPTQGHFDYAKWAVGPLTIVCAIFRVPSST